MRCGVIGDDGIACIGKSSLLTSDRERCRCITWLQEASAGKIRGDRVWTGNLIERKVARSRAGGVGDTGATLGADGECDCLGGHARRSPAKGKYS